MPEILDPLTKPAIVPVRAPELEIAAARRAFKTAQDLLSGGPVGPETRLDVGWYDSKTNPESGSFAVVALGAGLDDLIGEIVRVTFAGRVVYVYVLTSADVPWPMAVYRRVFMALMRPSVGSIAAKVVAVA